MSKITESEVAKKKLWENDRRSARITAADQGLILHSSDNSNNFQIGPP